ncbi:VOC family protein [Occallatibacter riparius]|uniref:VOC family protein n=1 Tax=Occallatibacter riparius TaxID=1002689 RepID=A0A9J7BWQ5_9BACT|nr:VOC family protein [Occallatibacter riparius]UWZ85302.1 VOC family protein [Occallatibacter riparius]
MKRHRAVLLAVLMSLPLFSQSPSGSANVDAAPISRVGFVMLGVADVGRAVDFYHGKLGLKINSQSDDLAFFDAGSISIVVSSEVGRQAGESEIVFAVEHVKQAAGALSRKGVHIEAAPHPLTATDWAASFKDPDGHVLSVYGPQ